jgi:thiosulfate dehydrogenase
MIKSQTVTEIKVIFRQKLPFLLPAVIAMLMIVFSIPGCSGDKSVDSNKSEKVATSASMDVAANTMDTADPKLISYGKDLIANTSKYFGPKGSLGVKANTLNCQNCHLDAGNRQWGNNYKAVASTYPKFRDRSGSIETIPKRVNDCFERSLNGKALDSASHEMLAIVAYIQSVGKNVPKGTKPEGAGIRELPFPARAASPAAGKTVYTMQCKSCHGQNGEGLKTPDGIYVYPPLWGEASYNTGAGLFRLSRLAGYVKDNMPFNVATHDKPVLTDEQSWDVAAFINSKPRPKKDLSKDWPDISKKPVDHPFGPYSDGFSEKEHKYGPFAPIVAARKKHAS